MIDLLVCSSLVCLRSRDSKARRSTQWRRFARARGGWRGSAAATTARPRAAAAHPRHPRRLRGAPAHVKLGPGRLLTVLDRVWHRLHTPSTHCCLSLCVQVASSRAPEHIPSSTVAVGVLPAAYPPLSAEVRAHLPRRACPCRPHGQCMHLLPACAAPRQALTTSSLPSRAGCGPSAAPAVEGQPVGAHGAPPRGRGCGGRGRNGRT